MSFWIVLPVAGAAYSLGLARRYWLAFGIFLLAAVAAVLMRIYGVGVGGVLATSAATEPSAAALFLAGLKGGLLTFGGAYAAIPFVRHDTVGRGWMSDAQFLDGLGLSGVLPAPLVIFVTFVGWVSGGPIGAPAITADMFLPAFAFSLLFYERLEAVLENKRLQQLLEGVAAGVVGLIVVTTIDLARVTAERTPSMLASLAIFAVALAVVYRCKSKLATPLVLGLGAAIGFWAHA